MKPERAEIDGLRKEVVTLGIVAVVIDVGLTLFYTGHAYLFYFAFDCWWPVQPATNATSSSRPD